MSNAHLRAPSSSQIIRVFRGLEVEEELDVDYAVQDALGMTLKMPHQLFINNEFIDASDGNEYDSINPAEESVGLSFCK